MYLVYSQNPAGSCVSCVLTISPSFTIRFPSFWFHSRRLRHLSVAGHVACYQLSSRVSYKSFSAVAGPMWPECPIRQSTFPCFKSRSAPPPVNPQLLVLCSHIVGTECITVIDAFSISISSSLWFDSHSSRRSSATVTHWRGYPASWKHDALYRGCSIQHTDKSVSRSQLTIGQL